MHERCTFVTCVLYVLPFRLKIVYIYGCICRCRMNSQLPKGSHVSPECKDLLMSLLRHDPRERITFDKFFAHDFLDLTYAPTKENYEKAVELIQRAVKMDAEKNSKEAFHLYCEALRYFIPIVTSKQYRHNYDVIT